MPPPVVLLQYLLPRRMLSKLAGWIVQIRAPWCKNLLIRAFVRHYQPDAQDSSLAPRDYPDFQAFFTRPLYPGRRPLPADPNMLVAPCDGRVSQIGAIQAGRLLQAKGRHYQLRELLGNESDAAVFREGRFVTLYLAPRDYHRIHMPLHGQLQKAHYLPGRLFAVNPATTLAVPRLLARNERLSCIFHTAMGPMAVILVGALLVSGIATVWDDHWRHGPGERSFRPPQLQLERGAPLGHFQFGSTAIVLLANPHPAWHDALTPNATVRMGTPLLATNPPPQAPS